VRRWCKPKLLLPVACAALLLAACATTPLPQTQPVAKADKPPAACVPAIATRLPVKDSECSAFGPTDAYKDLTTTGQPFADQTSGEPQPSVRMGR
jgi:hypothetical protein